MLLSLSNINLVSKLIPLTWFQNVWLSYDFETGNVRKTCRFQIVYF